MKKARKPKHCQWMEGFQSNATSGWHSCSAKPVFKVQYQGVTVGHVCGKHSISATQHGWQIR